MLVDFDGTAARQNVAEMLLKRFGGPSWRNRRKDFRRGMLTLTQYQEQAFGEIQAKPEEMAKFLVSEVVLRSGFLNLVDLCKRNGLQVAIVSSGLRFYIEAIMARHKELSEVEVVAPDMIFRKNGNEFSYVNSNVDCVAWGICKCETIEKAKKMGSHTIYVGEGKSDFCPAGIADVVFARSQLVRYCLEKKIPCVEFRTFNVISEYVKKMIRLPKEKKVRELRGKVD